MPARRHPATLDLGLSLLPGWPGCGRRRGSRSGGRRRRRPGRPERRRLGCSSRSVKCCSCRWAVSPEGGAAGRELRRCRESCAQPGGGGGAPATCRVGRE